MWNRNYRLKPFGMLKKEIEIVKNKYGMEANVMYRVWKSICEGEKLSKEMYHKCKSEGLIK